MFAIIINALHYAVLSNPSLIFPFLVCAHHAATPTIVCQKQEQLLAANLRKGYNVDVRKGDHLCGPEESEGNDGLILSIEAELLRFTSIS